MKKLRYWLCIILAVSIFFSNIVSVAAQTLETYRGQAVWQSVLNADLTSYNGERIPFGIDEPFGTPDGILSHDPSGDMIDPTNVTVMVPDTYIPVENESPVRPLAVMYNAFIGNAPSASTLSVDSSSLSTNSVGFYWNSVFDADSYTLRIYSTSNVLLYTFPNLTSTRYYAALSKGSYRADVLSVNPAGSNSSNRIDFTVTGPSASVLSVDSSSLSTGSVGFYWNSVFDADSYTLRIYSTSNVLLYTFPNITSTRYYVALSKGSYRADVLSVNSAGSNSSYRIEFTVTASPAPTLSVDSSSLSTNSVGFYWNSIPDASSYTLRIYDSTGTLINTFPNLTSTHYYVALSKGSYRADVLSVNSAGSNSSNRVEFTVTGPSASVLSVDSSTLSTNSVGFYWNSVFDADSYTLRIYSTSNVLLYTFPNITSTRYYVALSKGSYRADVLSVNSAGSNSSNRIEFTVTGPSASTLSVDSSSLSTNSVGFYWNSISEASSYTLLIYTSSGSLLNSFPNLTSTIYYVALSKGSYRAEVVSVNAAGSNSSNRVEFIVTGPSASTLSVDSSSLSTNSVGFYWNSVFDADSYTLRIYDSIGTLLNTFPNLTSTLYYVALSKGSYRADVLSVNSAGSNSSNRIEFTVTGPTASVLSVDSSSLSTGSVGFYWNSVFDADSYTLRIYNSNGTILNTFSNLTSTRYYVALSKGSYRADVLSVNSAGSNSSYRIEFTVETGPNILGSFNPLGNLFRSYDDLSLDAPGFTVNVSRVYNSIDTRDSHISSGWTFSFLSKLEVVGGDTVIFMPDGSARTFKIEVDGTYTARNSRARLARSGNEHILTTSDNYQYFYNAGGYMYRMADTNGNNINLTVNAGGQVTQVADAAGRTLTITYTDNHISAITESTTGRTVRYFYDSNGRLNQVTAPDGGNTYYTYYSDGPLHQVVNHNSTVLEQFAYERPQGSVNYRLTSAILPTGNTETYTYDVQENKVTTTTADRSTITVFDDEYHPVSITDAVGGKQRFEYNLDGGVNRYGEITSTTDRNGNTTSYEYDARGNVVKIVYPDRSTKLFIYDSNNNLTDETDELGNKTFYTYDSNHNLIKRVKPLDGVTVYAVSADQNLYAIESYIYYTAAEASSLFGRAIGGLIRTFTDAAGNVTTYTYDAQGNLATSRDSLNRTTTYSYNIIGWLRQETSPMGYTAKYYYDRCGRLLKKENHDGGSERYVYDMVGNLVQMISPVQYAGITDATTYTTQSIVETAASLANTVGNRYTYNIANLVETFRNPLNHTTSYSYDSFGNKTRETMPNGLVYYYTYDRLSRPTSKSYLESNNSILLETYSYPLQTDGTVKVVSRSYFSVSEYAETTNVSDFAGRLLRTINPDGGVTINTYLPNGLPKATTDAMGNTTYFEYNPMNQMVRRWSPHNESLYSLTEWQYDSAGRVTREASYVNVMSRGATPAGQAAVTGYTYNIDSTIRDITINGVGQHSYLYNNDRKVSQETRRQDASRSQRTDYTYDHRGEIATVTIYQENRDITGRPDNTSLFGITTSYSYDLNGNLARVTYPNGETVNYEYDVMNRQIAEHRNVLNENNVVTTVTRKTTYNNMGNITATTDENGFATNYTYSTRGFLMQFTDARSAVTAWEYDLHGRILREYSPRALLGDEPGSIVTPPINAGNWPVPPAFTASNYTGYSYDQMGRLLTKTEVYRPTSTSPAVSLLVENNTYDKNGNLLTAINARGNTTRYTYSAANHIINMRDANADNTQYSYDGLGHLTNQTDARGVVTQYTYDLFGNVLQQSVSGVTLTSTSYDYLGNPLTVRDANGNITRHEYTLNSQIRSATEPGGYNICNWYDSMGNNTRSLDSMGKETINVYDNWGRLLTVRQQRSDGSEEISTSTRYDVLGNPVYVVDARGNTTRYSYDRLSRVISIRNPLNQTTAITYDANGNKVSETDWRGNTTTYRYDILNRLIGIIDPSGTQVETLTYMDIHLQASSTDALGNVTKFAYDLLGRHTATTDAEGYSTRQTYDAAGNILSKTDGNNRTTYYNYDDFSRLVSVTGADKAITSYTYDAVGNLLTQTDGRGNTVRYAYDSRNRLTLRADPGGISETGAILDESRIERYTWYLDGNLQSRRDKNGVTQSFTYDIHGRKVSESLGGDITTYQYDNAGNLLRVEDSSGAIIRDYDALNRVTGKTAPDVGTTTFTYDITSGMGTGQIGESTTIDGVTTTRVFDRSGRLHRVLEGDTVVSAYEYYPNGSVKTQTLPNGITANYTYYANNRLHTLANMRGSLILEAYQYAYDGAGNMTAKQDVRGTTVYTYTAANQLSSVTEPSGKVTAYTYDRSGNRERETVTENGETKTTVYTVNEQNRLIRAEEVSGGRTVTNQYLYDASGSLLSRIPEMLTQSEGNAGSGVLSLSLMGDGDPDDDDLSPAIYGYNGKNQMVEAVTGSAAVTNVYNAEGLRSSKTADGATTHYAYEYSRVIAEYDSEGGAAYNVYGLNLIFREIYGERVYYLYNGNGDVTGLVDSNGEIIVTYYYDAFGNIAESTGNFSNPYRYAGYMYDMEVKLYYLSARFYDAGIARFMQEDTYLGERDDPLSLNLYTYVFNNPLKYHDPTGHAAKMYQGNIDILEKNGLAYLIDEIGYIAATSVANQLRGGNAVVNTSDSKSVSVSDQTLINLASVNKATVTNGDLINLANINKAIVKNGNLENYGYINTANVSDGSVTNDGYIDNVSVTNSNVTNNGTISKLVANGGLYLQNYGVIACLKVNSNSAAAMHNLGVVGKLNSGFKSNASIINDGVIGSINSGVRSNIDLTNNYIVENLNMNKGGSVNIQGNGLIMGYNKPVSTIIEDISYQIISGMAESLMGVGIGASYFISGASDGFFPYVDINYSHNLDLQTQINDFIHGQSSNTAAAQMQMGRFAGDYNGCGWVSIYNAGRIMGIDFQPAEIIRYLDSGGGLFIDGLLGANPLAINSYLQVQGINTNMYNVPRTGTLDSLIQESSASILEYWHGNGAHYVAVEYVNGSFNVYNEYNDNTIANQYTSIDSWLRNPPNNHTVISLITLK